MFNGIIHPVKNRIPIVTRDLLPIPPDLIRLLTSYNEENEKDPHYIPHHLFADLLLSGSDGNLQYPSLPKYCIQFIDWIASCGIIRCNDTEYNGSGFINDDVDGDYKDKHFSQGVYFCLRESPLIQSDGYGCFHEIIYVGKTNDIEQRFTQHHKKEAFKFLNIDRVMLIGYNPEYYTESDLLWAERQYIDMLKPVLNDRSCLNLFSGSDVESKSTAIQDISNIWDQAYNEGVKHGFESAKNSMMDFFDSAIQMPNTLK